MNKAITAHRIIHLMLLINTIPLLIATSQAQSQGYQERIERTKWFREARFGMFIHWGIYAIPARGEWVRSAEKMTIEDYQAYFDEFDPYLYDPKEWAKIAKEAGMKYAVLTAKHHGSQGSEQRLRNSLPA